MTSSRCDSSPRRPDRLVAALIRERLFPGGCGICGGLLVSAREAWYGLCGPCAASFSLEKEPRCSSCGRPLISELQVCMSCRNNGVRAIEVSFALYPYGGKFKELLGAYKFRKRLAVGNFLAERLLDGLSQYGLPWTRFPWIPVPPRPGKLKKNGWDQISYLGKRLRKLYGLRILPILQRLPSKSQKELDRESRRVNLKGKIVCREEPPLEAVLFDDVITTGSTLNACADALQARGAQRVYAFSLFYD